MPRATKKATVAETVSELLLSDKEQAALNAERELGIDREVRAVLAADKPALDETALLAQFASTLLRTTAGLYLSDEEGLRQRVRDAIGRARVMLDEFKIQLGA